jgi:hypothetical protein
MIADSRFHRRCDPERLMDAPEVVPHVEQRNGVRVILDLLREAVRQAGESPDLHPHREILPLYEAGRDVVRIGAPDHLNALSCRALRGAVPLLPLGMVAVDLDELRVVDSARERVNHGPQIHLVAVGGQLDSIRETTGNVFKELGSAPRIPPSNKPTDGQPRVSFDGDKGPDISADLALGPLLRHVLLLAAHERRDLIDLNRLGWDVAERPRLILGARPRHFRQEPEDGAFRHASRARSGANRAHLDQGRHYLDLLGHAELVHTSIMLQRFSMSRRKSRFLGLFLLGPASFGGLGCDLPAALIREGFQSALASDPASSAAHFGHDSGQNRRIGNHGKTDLGFPDRGFSYPPGVLNGIQLRCASALSHHSTLARIGRSCQEGGISN